MAQYVALLRGINVGGGNKILMADLKICLEKLGHKNVTTYIQSGNVVFEATETNVSKLTSEIEGALSKTFAPYKARVVLRSQAQLQNIVAKAPKGFGSDPAHYRYDVIFLKDPMTVAEAMKSVTANPGVDTADTGPHEVIYFSRLIAKATASHLNRVVTLPVYQHMTIRNWNTTTKLLALMDKTS